MADIFGYNTRNTPYGTVRTPAVDYSALGQYGLDFIRNTVNLPTTLWNANKAVGNAMLNGAKTLNNNMYTYDPATAGKQVKQFVTGQQQSNTNQIIPNQPSSKNTQTTKQTVNNETGTDNTPKKKITSSSSSTGTKQQVVKNPVFDDIAQSSFSDAYNKAISPDATPADIAKVQQMSDRYGLGLTSKDVVNARNYTGQPVAGNTDIQGQTVVPVANNGDVLFGNALTNPVYQGTINGQPATVEQDKLHTLDAGSVAGFNEMGGNYGKYEMPYTNQVDTSATGITQYNPVTVNNQNPSSAFLNNANSPAKVAGQVYWDNNGRPSVYQPQYTPTGDTFKDMYAQQLMQQTSPADAWSKVGWGDAWNKGEGISGGLSNLWDKATAQTGNAMNPQASALEKAFGGLSSAANIYSALQNQRYQSKLADIYGQQVGLQRQAQEQTLANQQRAADEYKKSFS